MGAQLNITVSCTDDGLFHVIGESTGDSQADALKAVQMVWDRMAFGRTGITRALPEANSDTSFDTKITLHRGYVRFTFLDEPGEMLPPNSSVPISFAEVA